MRLHFHIPWFLKARVAKFGGGWGWVQRRQWHPTPVLLSGKSHGQRSLVGCSPWARWESDTTERLHFHFSLSCIGEGNGNPLQCSCLKNPRDGALKQLSSSSSVLYTEERNGNPLQYSCLENPMDREAWLQSIGLHRFRHDWSDLAEHMLFIRCWE